MSEAVLKVDGSELSHYEAIIQKGMDTFVEVGTALLEIRDRKLYLNAHETFENYCRDRWAMTRRHADRQIEAAQVVVNMRPIGLKSDPLPKTESQARPLAKLPKEEQSKAWKEAVDKTNGKPTAKAVQEVVDARLGKPTGKSTVNGVVRDDPPDIARARAAGKIAPDVIPEVTEVEATEFEPIVEPPTIDLTTDEEWLDSLPVRAKISPTIRKWFDEDAILYRRLSEARKSFRSLSAKYMRKANKDGKYAYKVSRFLRIEDPRDWIVCPPLDKGGCDGKGVVGTLGRCPECFGQGYYLPGKKRP